MGKVGFVPAFLFFTNRKGISMTQPLTEQTLFKPQPSNKAQTKADMTDSAARAIIGEEARRREEKTARLREARLAREAAAAAAAAKPAIAPKRRKIRSGS
ncbi:hypothetical protein L610_001100000350 [Aminobacter sp. J44]|nr:hypothetical protein L610_001100000350 [Aminobacter sp. J44]